VGGHHGHGPDGNVKLDEDGVVDTNGIDPDDAKRKRKGNRDDDYLLAVAEAKLLAEAQEKLGTPALLAAKFIFSTLKVNYPWVSRIEARIDGIGVFDFFIYASPGNKFIENYVQVGNADYKVEVGTGNDKIDQFIPTEIEVQDDDYVSELANKIKDTKEWVGVEVWPHSPITVVRVDGKNIIINGHHRYQAAISFGYSGDIPFEAIPIEDSPYSMEEILTFLQ
jgi:hypothetical protein